MQHPDNVYHERVIRICELAGDEGVIENSTFEGCDIRGPAVLVLQGTRPDSVRLENNSFEGSDMNAILWEIDPNTRPEVIGAILCVDCAFENCTFRKIGLAGPPEFTQMIKGGVGIP